MSNEVVIILSHADTTDKLEILDECVAEIKKQGYQIIISSHIELPKKYYNIVDYIVYDMDNPMIKYSNSGAAHVFMWQANAVYKQSFPLEYNHSYAVMKLIKTGLGVAYTNGYEKAHFVNYDYVLNDPSILKTHSESININDIYSYYYDLFDISRRHITTGLFSVKIKPFLEFSNKINSTQDFLNHNEAIFEKFVYAYYVERCGLTVELTQIEPIFEGNIINGKSVLKNVIDDRISVYLAREETTDEYFVSLRIKGDHTEEVLIGTDDSVFSFYPTQWDNINIIDVTDIIKNGLSINISIPKYGFTDIYNLSTHCATCSVIDRNIIKKLSEVTIKENYKNMLNEKYKAAMLIQPDNISEHLPTLKKYSEECEHVTEMGVDRVVSTYALMMGYPKKMISYDINPIESYGINRDSLKSLGSDNGIDYTFIDGDTTKIEIEETDLLFIDTEHNYLQLKTELLLHANKVKKYIIFHDTVTYGYTDSNYYGHYVNLKEIENEDNTKHGIMPAINEFLERNPNWVIHETYENCNGLLIIKNNKESQSNNSDNSNMKKTFLEISNSVDCDKSTYHMYDKVYPDFIERFRDDSFSMFEIGIEAGKSFKIWEQYFPNAKIYGMDIGVSFKNERGEVFLGDQSKNEDLARIVSTIDKCKLILDDGSHIAEHQLKTFYYLFENLLEPGGVYIIEDIECSYWKPKSILYGYETGHLNIIEYFTKLNHAVNSHYSLYENNLHIKSITFAPNCIIITKKTQKDIDDDNRPYRFINCILNEWRIL
jgi:hypothetical protein